MVSSCAKCKRYDARRASIETAPLPIERVDLTSSFNCVGIDAAGPLYLKDSSKVWVMVFTCAVYRGVHFELVNSMSTESFVMALRRFISRRTRPTVIYSDNGSNFVGLNNLLKNLNWDEIIKKISLLPIK